MTLEEDTMEERSKKPKEGKLKPKESIDSMLQVLSTNSRCQIRAGGWLLCLLPFVHLLCKGAIYPWGP